ncbi:MAG: hypothetical protein L0Z53_06525 [Acidobacteriales bacterium]|nr:hypothetical protein [Terriglobales bacterium]
MPLHPAGIVSDLSAANASAFNRIELNPTTVIQLTEAGISMNAAPNSTLVPVEFNLKRTTTVGTGAAGTVVKIRKDLSAALATTALVENTADGTLADVLHRWFVPVVSGLIWVAAPNREPDVQAAEFLGIQNVAALGASINAACYLCFEE